MKFTDHPRIVCPHVLNFFSPFWRLGFGGGFWTSDDLRIPAFTSRISVMATWERI
jgi:hypothetical protein